MKTEMINNKTPNCRTDAGVPGKESLRPVVFVDRDGTLNEDSPLYIRTVEAFQLLKGVRESVARLTEWGCLVVVVSNQSGLARGFFSEETLSAMHELLKAEITAAGGRIDDIFYCPHLPKDDCHCRKPEIGMFEAAAERHPIDLESMFMIGDSASDILAGHRFGCTTILLKSSNYVEIVENLKTQGVTPDSTSDDFSSAVEQIIGRLNRIDRQGKPTRVI